MERNSINTADQVSIIVLAYNSQKHLPPLFESIAAQTYPNIQVVVVDNASSDDTVEWVQQQEILPYDLLANEHNDWYAKGNNDGIKLCTGEYIVFCNDDVTLEPECIEQLVEVFQSRPHTGMAGGKLLKLHTNESGEAIIDSAGLAIQRNRKAINRGENEVDTGQYDVAERLFGITGALMMISRSAYETVSLGEECFDNDFVAYKEDIDLSWRMWQHGFEVRYNPRSVAHHARSIQKTDLSQRGQKPQIIRQYSYRNHLWMLIKNENRVSFVKDAVYILPYEFMKFLYILFREPNVLRIIPQFLSGIRIMRKKRRFILENSYSINGSSTRDPIRSWIQ